MTKKSKFDLFPVSVHLIFRQDNQLLMMRRNGTGFCDGMYSIPAGHVLKSETVLQAAIREGKEEVGLIFDLSECKVIGTMFRYSTEGRIDFFIEVESWSGEPKNLEPDKCDDLSWFSSQELPENTIPYVRKALINATDVLWYEEFV
ncbi:MAG: NUDIX domain-containing protein [Pyrinomonadaceae bacterium]|nr:NUDIX domain-containing protein [Pyrinomonadaceae bacterium]